MKVLLINPTQEFALASEAGDAPREATGPYPPLGLLYLRAALERNGAHQVEIADETVYGHRTWIDEKGSREAPPDLVGVSALTPNLVGVARTVEAARRAFPDTIIVVGGPHSALFPKETAMLDGVDHVLVGEADETLPALVQAIDEGTTTTAIPGLFTRSTPAGEDAMDRPWVRDLDTLPIPDRSRLDVRRYKGLIRTDETFTTMISSRGCPFRCSFCSTPQGRFRARSVGSITEELKGLRALGIEHVYFVDDTFPTDARRLAALCDELSRVGGTPTWSCRTTAEGLTREGLGSMKRGGCVRVQIGVETGTDKGLRALGKPASIGKMRDLFAEARRLDLETMAYFMIGLPNEDSAEEVRETIRFAKELSPSYAMFNVLTLYPGSRLYREAMASGMVEGDPWREFARQPDPSFVPPLWRAHLNRDELHALQREAYRGFYWRPRMLWQQLRTSGGVRGAMRRLAIGLEMLKS